MGFYLEFKWFTLYFNNSLKDLSVSIAMTCFWINIFWKLYIASQIVSETTMVLTQSSIKPSYIIHIQEIDFRYSIMQKVSNLCRNVKCVFVDINISDTCDHMVDHE